MWLNNCVGERNYKSFFGLVVSLFIFKFTKFVLTIDFLMKVDEPIITIGIISILFDPIVLIIITYLLSTHIYFRYIKQINNRLKGITTYDWIKL